LFTKFDDLFSFSQIVFVVALLSLGHVIEISRMVGWFVGLYGHIDEMDWLAGTTSPIPTPTPIQTAA